MFTWHLSLASAPNGVPVLAEDRVVVATSSALTVIDGEDGDVLWSHAPPGGVQSGVTYDRFVLLWVDRHGSIRRSPLDDFIVATDAELPFSLDGAPRLHPSRQRTFFAGAGQLACLSGNYGDVLWRFDSEHDARTWCAVGEDRVVLAVARELVVLAVEDGRCLSRNDLPGAVAGGPWFIDEKPWVLLEDQRLCAGDGARWGEGVLPLHTRWRDHDVFALTGGATVWQTQEQWTLPAPPRALTSHPDGVYACADGRLWSLSRDTPARPLIDLEADWIGLAHDHLFVLCGSELGCVSLETLASG